VNGERLDGPILAEIELTGSASDALTRLMPSPWSEGPYRSTLGVLWVRASKIA